MAKKASVPLYSLVAGINSRSTRDLSYTKVMSLIKTAAGKRPLSIVFRVPAPPPPAAAAAGGGAGAGAGAAGAGDHHSKMESFVSNLQQSDSHKSKSSSGTGSGSGSGSGSGRTSLKGCVSLLLFSS